MDPSTINIRELFANQSATWILSANSETLSLEASKSTIHGGFDDDKPAVRGTLSRIVGSSGTVGSAVEFTYQQHPQGAYAKVSKYLSR